MTQSHKIQKGRTKGPAKKGTKGKKAKQANEDNKELVRPQNDSTDVQAALVDNMSEAPAQEGFVLKVGDPISQDRRLQPGKLVKNGTKAWLLGCAVEANEEGIGGIGEYLSDVSPPRPAPIWPPWKRRARAPVPTRLTYQPRTLTRRPT